MNQPEAECQHTTWTQYTGNVKWILPKQRLFDSYVSLLSAEDQRADVVRESRSGAYSIERPPGYSWSVRGQDCK